VTTQRPGLREVDLSNAVVDATDKQKRQSDAQMSARRVEQTLCRLLELRQPSPYSPNAAPKPAPATNVSALMG